MEIITKLQQPTLNQSFPLERELKLTHDQFRLLIFSEMAYAALKTSKDKDTTSKDRLNKQKDFYSTKYPHLNLSDYTIVESNQDMYVAVNEKNHTAVLAVRGTSISKIRDLFNDLDLIFGDKLRRFKTLKDFAENFMKKHSGYALTLTGHSLGGYLAELYAVETGIPCETFNRGSTPLVKHSKPHSHIKSHIVSGDFVSKWSGLGEVVSWSKEKGVGAHKTETFFSIYNKQLEKIAAIMDKSQEFYNASQEVSKAKNLGNK